MSVVIITIALWCLVAALAGIFYMAALPWFVTAPTVIAIVCVAALLTIEAWDAMS
jgi:hypothetical protein